MNQVALALESILELEAKQQIAVISWSALASVLSLSSRFSRCDVTQSSCQSCVHCTPPAATGSGWCRLRRLSVHAELANQVFCHHWTCRPPALPELNLQEPLLIPLDRQLDFCDSMQTSDQDSELTVRL
jgi:hypothetical protein